MPDGRGRMLPPHARRIVAAPVLFALATLLLQALFWFATGAPDAFFFALLCNMLPFAFLGALTAAAAMYGLSSIYCRFSARDTAGARRAWFYAALFMLSGGGFRARPFGARLPSYVLYGGNDYTPARGGFRRRGAAAAAGPANGGGMLFFDLVRGASARTHKKTRKDPAASSLIP